MRIMRAFLRGTALCGAVAFALTGCTATVGSSHFIRQYSARASTAGVQRLVVTGQNGDVTATAADVSAVEIRARIETSDLSQLDRDTVSVTRSGGDLVVSSACNKAWILFWSIQNCGIDYEITYPKHLSISVTNTNGDTLVVGAAAPIEAETENGDITIRAAGSDIVARSHQGDVEASLAQQWSGSRISMHTTFGDVILSASGSFRGGIAAHTVAGDISGHPPASAGRTVAQLSTTFGDIDFRRI